MKLDSSYLQEYLQDNSGWIISLLLFLGILIMITAIYVLGLSTDISKGKKGQAAIQMLDAMRRPFFAIDSARSKLFRTNDTVSAKKEYSKAFESSRSFLQEYRKLAQYNPELAGNIDRLIIIYGAWEKEERHLLSDYERVFPHDNRDIQTWKHIIVDSGKAGDAFLKTMHSLGDGEAPMHQDIEKGTQAYNLLLQTVTAFFLYLIGLVFLQLYAGRSIVMRSHDELERQIEARTRELLHSNEELVQKNNEHQRSEETLDKKNRFLQILQEITASANQASSVDDVMQYVLDQVCAYTGWPLGHVYVQDDQCKNKIIPTKLWHIDNPEKYEPFRNVTEVTQFERGIGLPGIVAETKKPAWLNDLHSDPKYPRAEMANKVGIRTAFAFPVFLGTEVVAILEFFSLEPQSQPTEGEIDVMAYIGSQLEKVIERKQAERALILSEKEWRLTFDSISDFVSLHDTDLRTLRVNKSLADYAGKKPDELVGNNCHELFHCSKEQQRDCRAMRTAQPHATITVEIVDSNNKNPLHVTKSPVFDENGQLSAYVHIVRDISERKKFEKRLEQLAHYDHLTGLANRTLFIDHLNQALVTVQENKRLMAVLFLDLDRFKVLNDSLGHDTGDRLLESVAERLKGIMRKGDMLTRLGGDEFAISLVDVAKIQDIATVAGNIVEVFVKPFMIDSRELFITASIGISICPDDGMTSSELLKNADIAMYSAKNTGKNNYKFYSTGMGATSPEFLTMENDLRHALEREEFILHYQPKVDLVNGVITGMEALLRWQHPKQGLLPPDRFIHILEETGIIVPVGRWVLNSACHQNKAWQEMGFRPMRVSVNVSGRQFVQNNIVEDVFLVLSESGLDSQYLELEITESTLVEYTEETKTALQEIAKNNVYIAIDDFGTGYSSLSYLRQFPIKTLKIDRSFISKITTRTKDAELTKTIIAMGRNLGLGVIAEGVETKEQAEFLLSNQCNEIQGYYYCHPLPAAEFTKFLEENQSADVSPPDMLKVSSNKK